MPISAQAKSQSLIKHNGQWYVKNQNNLQNKFYYDVTTPFAKNYEIGNNDGADNTIQVKLLKNSAYQSGWVIGNSWDDLADPNNTTAAQFQFAIDTFNQGNQFIQKHPKTTAIQYQLKHETHRHWKVLKKYQSQQKF